MGMLIAYAGEQAAEQVVSEVHRLAPDWQVTYCCSLAAAEKLLTEESWQVVVWDLDLLEGASLAELERSRALAPDSYFIVVVAPASQMLGAHALAAGADYHITKHERWLHELLLVAKQADRIVSQRQQTRQLRQFTEYTVGIGSAIATNRELPDLLEAVGRATMSITGAACCWIEVLDEQASQFAQHYAYAGPEADAVAWEAEVHDIAWRAVHHDDLLVEQLDDAEGCAWRLVAVPITAGGPTLGALTIVTPAHEPLLRLHRDGLQFLAGLAAVTIQNDQLRHLVQLRTQQTEAAATQAWEEEARARTLLSAAMAVTDTRAAPEVLNKIATNAAAEIGFDCVAIYLADHDHNLLKGALQAGADGTVSDISDHSLPLRSGDNFLADAALGDEPYVLYPPAQSDQPEAAAAEDDYPTVLVPLRARGNLVGIIVADNHDCGTLISPQQIRLLRSLAGITSVALERIRVDELRDLFVSSISHELRTPLASLQATNELVLDEEVGPLNDEQRRYLGRIDAACRNMRRILDDLTDWSHLQAGQIPVRRRLVDLREPIRHATDALHPPADEAGVQIQLDLPAESLEVFTDPGRLEQVIINLVDNAVKFNYNGGQVEVSASTEDGEAVIKVADTGPGIPPGLHERVFEAFNRGSEETSRAVEGIGLGLAIASQITRLLGGRISIESEPGEGSTFAIHLPLDAETSQAPEQA